MVFAVGGSFAAIGASGEIGNIPGVSNATSFLGGFMLLVGSRACGGCTSGHGVCGMGRGSRRSIVATLTFMATAVLTVSVVRHVLGGVG